MLTGLLLGGGFLYWLGLLRAQWLLVLTGAATLLVAMNLLAKADGIDPLALPVIALAGLWAFALKQYPIRAWQIIGWTVLVIFLLALGFRVVPYFEPVTLLPPLATEPYAFRPEKLVLMLLAPPMVLMPWSQQSEARFEDRPLLVSGLIILALTGLIMGLVMAFSDTAPGFPRQAPIHLFYILAYNLLFTCVLEEAFFRGIVQPALITAFAKRVSSGKAAVLGIAAASVLFGLAHIAGGPAFIILATIAGVGYGLDYHWTGRLYYAVLVHFGFNAVRLLAFSG
ncbi:MAG: CPBP family intramembrane glutamic endopeptidase [Gammaproteobacteria bacterium]